MAKKSKSLLPKRIGKVKVGKSVRKGALADVLTSKAGQALIAEAVLAVGAIAAAQLSKARELKKDRKAAGAVAKIKGAKIKAAKAGREANAATATLTYALGEAVRSFSAALHRAPADRAAATDGPTWAPPEPVPATKAAKPRVDRTNPPAGPPN